MGSRRGPKGSMSPSSELGDTSLSTDDDSPLSDGLTDAGIGMGDVASEMMIFPRGDAGFESGILAGNPSGRGLAIGKGE